METCKTSFLVSVLLLGLSPVLGSLTDTVSTDTVYAMSIALLALHLLVCDYSGGSADDGSGRPTFGPRGGRGAVALNCALFGAVCVASRLPDTASVFAFMVFSLQLFALMPLLRSSVKRWSVVSFAALSTLVIAGALGVVLCVSGPGAFAYAAAVVFVSVICPLWLVYSQQYKE